MKKFLIFLTIVIVLFGVQLYIDANILETSYYQITSSSIPETFDGFRILQLSDLHSKEFGEGSSDLIDATYNIAPDIIVMTGDMITAGEYDYTVFFELSKKLASQYEIYYIPGNHELDLKNEKYTELMKTIESFGITVLDNEKVELKKDNESIDLYGMWYNSKYYSKDSSATDFNIDVMNEIIGDEDDKNFDVLLTHNPKHFETYSTWGAELTLCGHVHGGMVRLPWIGGVFSTERTLFPKYDAEIYNLDDHSMIVSRGLGRGKQGFRLFNRPEICVIILNAK